MLPFLILAAALAQAVVPTLHAPETFEIVGLHPQELLSQADAILMSEGFNAGDMQPAPTFAQKLKQSLATNSGGSAFEPPRGVLYINYFKNNESVRVIVSEDFSGPVVDTLWYSIHGPGLDLSIPIKQLIQRFGDATIKQQRQWMWCPVIAGECDKSKRKAVLQLNTNGGVDVWLVSSTSEHAHADIELLKKIREQGNQKRNSSL